MSTRAPLTVVFFVLLTISVQGQSTASLEGLITDQHGALIRGAEITATDRAIGFTRVAVTDSSGRYQIVALPIGDYRLEVRANGFQTGIVERVRLEVGRRLTQDFELQVGDISGNVLITESPDLLERSTISVGHEACAGKAPGA